MKKFKTHLAEAKKSTVVVSFGRMNPMTNGHEKLANKLKSEAASRSADAKLYLSHSTNPKKDPLPFDTKVKYATKAFGPMVQHSAARTIIEVAKELTGKYSSLVVVVGSDRVPEFKTLLNKYNGKDFTFDSIEIVSAGERDPDAEGVEGMSGSKMRRFAEDEDFASFRKGVPSKLSDDDAKGLFDAVRKGMKLDEEVKVEEVETVDEAVLSLSQRRERAIQFKRLQAKIQRARMLSMKRFADPKHLKLRARRQARNFLKSRFSTGKSYDAMGTGQKIAVDKRLEKLKPVVGKIAVRLLPKVRQAEVKRKMNTMRAESVNEAFKETFTEANDRLDQLVRLGLADKAMLTTIKRSVSKLNTGESLNPNERKATDMLITTLLDMVTSSDALFKLTRSQLQKESIQLLEQEEDKIELDGLHMAKIEVAALADDCEDLLEILDGMEEEPDAWVQSKISLATDYIASVKDYLEFSSYGEPEEDEEPEEEDVEDEYEDVEEALLAMSKEDFGDLYEEFKDIIEEIGGLRKKAEKSGIDYSIIKEVYARGIQSYDDSASMTAQQWAYARVNSFISGGATTKEDDADLWESAQKNLKFSAFVSEAALEWGTDAARMAYARMTPGQSQEIINARYSAEAALEVINNANLQRALKLYSEEACCDECEDEIVEEVDWDLVLHEAQYQGKEVTLNKPFYTPDGPKKSAVYTMGPNDKVVIVRFGDPNMEIKKDNPERRASFRARHNCDDPGPKWKARYWSCKAW